MQIAIVEDELEQFPAAGGCTCRWPATFLAMFADVVAIVGREVHQHEVRRP